MALRLPTPEPAQFMPSRYRYRKIVSLSAALSQWAIANNCRVLYAPGPKPSRSTVVKDLPLVKKLLEKNSVTLSKGRNNYICINRWEKLLRGDRKHLTTGALLFFR